MLGAARTGTTWLSNLIGRHPGVACVAHRVHWGLCEAKILRAHLWAGDLRNDRSLIRFLEIYRNTDYARLAGVDVEHYYANRPRDFFEFYLDVRDRHAAAENASHWVGKLDPLFAAHPKQLEAFLAALRDRYEQVKFVCIRRGFRAALRSYLRFPGRESIHNLPYLPKRLAVVKYTAGFAVWYAAFRDLVRRHDGMEIDYEALVGDRESVLRTICDEAGLDFAPEMLDSPYAANSSHRRPSGTRPPSVGWIWTAERILLPLMHLTRGGVRRLMSRRRHYRAAHPPFRWHLMRWEKMPESFARDLVKTGRQGLRDVLFGDAEVEPGAARSDRGRND